MRKFLLIILFIFISTQFASASTFCDKSNSLAEKQIRNVLMNYVKYENAKNINGIKRLHSDNYITVDAMPKMVYLDIINKTWAKYSDVKHQMKIKNIQINGDFATAEVEEILLGNTVERIDNKDIKGELKSISNVVYYLENINNSWKFVSDYVIDEQTVLAFEKAKDLDIDFYAPNRILANKNYVATLKVKGIPSDSIIIATIGQEKIIYPHKNAEEVYRKIPKDGTLERVFTSNTDNLNEYVVATYCLTKPMLNKEKQVETILTGVGYIINRVNVVPENKFITVEKNGKKEKKE